MTVLTSATAPVAQMRKELAYLIEQGERARSTLAALDLLFPNERATKPVVYGNGEPDAELARAAGIGYPGNVRPDKWRRYLKFRRDGSSTKSAAYAARINLNTATKLDALV